MQRTRKSKIISPTCLEHRNELGCSSCSWLPCGTVAALQHPVGVHSTGEKKAESFFSSGWISSTPKGNMRQDESFFNHPLQSVFTALPIKSEINAKGWGMWWKIFQKLPEPRTGSKIVLKMSSIYLRLMIITHCVSWKCHKEYSVSV